MKLMTSWTDDRETIHCLLKSVCCNLFEWIDSEMCARSKVIIQSLLRKLTEITPNRIEIMAKNQNRTCYAFILKYDYITPIGNIPIFHVILTPPLNMNKRWSKVIIKCLIHN
ncbi:unnamed protein product [Cuscuta europaea]|uniref:Uncharacterized protein n=1 Tax=Cuscuta europaea TaxID=41803 RepID=A0A9P0ZBN0_CUSEU|nr:unnamed protein product [Cuscuta europaea]